MKLHSLLLLALALSGTPTDNDTVFQRIDALLRAEGLTPARHGYVDPPSKDWPFKLVCDYDGDGPQLGVTLNCGRCDSPASKERSLHRIQTAEGAPGGYHNDPFLTASLGESYYSPAELFPSELNGLSRRLNAVADRYVIEVSVRTSAKGTVDELAARKARVRTFIERLGRRILGEAMALDLNDDGSERETAHLTGAEVDKRGMVTLAAWAQNHGVTVTYNDTLETASFTYHGKSVRLPLASNKAVVNDQEVTLGGKFIIARGSRWFVPGSELTMAIG